MTSSPGSDALVGLALFDADIPTLTQIWLAALDSFADVAGSLNASQWTADSPCPGWTAGDVVAHVLALESELHGEPVPDHEPDWDELPHVTTPFGRYTEIPVDWRRAKERGVVVAELREIIEWRRQDLADGPTDPAETVTGPGGWQTSREQLIKTRILDTYLHEQDLRTAAGLPGNYDSDAAWVTAGQLALALPRAWGKGAGAPIGAGLHLIVDGPGVTFSRCVQVGEDGRARFIESQAIGSATVSFKVSWPTFLLLAGGRLGASSAAHHPASEIHGDMELANRLLPALAATP